MAERRTKHRTPTKYGMYASGKTDEEYAEAAAHTHSPCQSCGMMEAVLCEECRPEIDVIDEPCVTDCCDQQERRHIHISHAEYRRFTSSENVR